MKRLLFVDDEPRVLDGLRRMLHGLRGQWQMDFVDSGAEALRRLAEQPYDVVLTDMRMPGMDGAQLLGEIMKTHPATIRIVLSGQCDRQTVLATVDSAHQFRTKPCDPEVLKATLSRACAARDRLVDEEHRSLVSRIRAVPSLPRIHAELVAEVESPDCSMERIGRIIASDVGMSAKILQLVSTSFFGNPQRISDPACAAALFDLDTIRTLVLSSGVLAPLSGPEDLWPVLELFNAHAHAVAAAARTIALVETGDARLADEARLAGLLHDVWAPMIAQHLPEVARRMVAAVRNDGGRLAAIERAAMGTTHAALGGYLVAIWGLSDSITEAVALHHEPSRSTDRAFSPLTAVHVADALDAQRWGASGDRLALLDRPYLDRLGLAGRVDAWQDACHDPNPEGVVR